MNAVLRISNVHVCWDLMASVSWVCIQIQRVYACVCVRTLHAQLHLFLWHERVPGSQLWLCLPWDFSYLEEAQQSCLLWKVCTAFCHLQLLHAALIFCLLYQKTMMEFQLVSLSGLLVTIICSFCILFFFLMCWQFAQPTVCFWFFAEPSINYIQTPPVSEKKTKKNSC